MLKVIVLYWCRVLTLVVLGIDGYVDDIFCGCDVQACWDRRVVEGVDRFPERVHFSDQLLSPQSQ